MIVGRGGAAAIGIALLLGFAAARTEARDFQFHRDTPGFTNMTVFEYRDGTVQSTSHKADPQKQKRYTRRCFVMSRSTLQFFKFARFEPKQAPPNDDELKRRVRQVARMDPWKPALPDQQRIVFPGYADFRHLSKARTAVLQENLGKGWPAYVRPGNYRMFFLCYDRDYQKETHQILNETMARHGFFVAYLADFPHLHINHAVLVYARKASRPGSAFDRYLTYDPNHPEGPRELTWTEATHEFSFQKDETFRGGFTNVYQVYGKWLQ